MFVVAPSGNWVRQLRRFVQPPSIARCELCGSVIADAHPHMVDTVGRHLLCVCPDCAATTEPGESRLRRLPAKVRRLENFNLTDAEWESLQIPIGMAFMFHSTPQGRVVALYPGPAGATESLLPLAGWSDLVACNPALADLDPDVEALLIDRIGERRDYYLVPIDRCYALVGLLRKHWRGLSGGTEAWQAIGEFFTRLRGSVGVIADWSHG